MQVTLEQARDIVDGRDGNQQVDIASFSEIKSTSSGYTLYYLTLSEPDVDRAYLLLVSPLAPRSPSPPKNTTHSPVSLPALSALLSAILDRTAVPVPRPVAHDDAGGAGRWPFGWLLLRVPWPTRARPPPSLASMRPHLTSTQLARIELRLGTHLRALHGLDNPWFGAPGEEPPPLSMPSFEPRYETELEDEGYGGGEEMIPYSWQDTFVLRLEELIDRACGDPGLGVDVQALRRALFRAIGSFLFDDVEMPGLVWVTGNEEDVIVSLEDAADVAYILPTFGHALWGDPLMEGWFLPPGPSTAMKEGYFDGEEDGTLIVFPRHKTKRTWYTVYLALLILTEETSRGGEQKAASDEERVRWARDILPECVEFLKDAPCY